MEISYEKDKYIEELIELSFFNYCREVEVHADLQPMTKDSFAAFMKERLKNMDCIIYLEDGNPVAFLAWDYKESKEKVSCEIPVWGYGAEGQQRERNIGMLFQQLAENLVTEKEVQFFVHLYAHDGELQRLFCYMQFGMLCESGIRFIGESRKNILNEVRDIRIKRMDKEEVQARWPEVWELLGQLIGHLQRSPVFYPGEEFTEEVYKQFFMSEDTVVYVAELDQRMIGILEGNEEKPSIFSHLNIVNVGEAFVLPEYRDSKIAGMMLAFLDEQLRSKSIPYEWVEHGTANPNGRGFWKKYFTTYEYEMTRNIKPVNKRSL